MSKHFLTVSIVGALFISGCSGKSQIIPYYIFSGGGRDTHLEECKRAHPVQAYMRACPKYPRKGSAPITRDNANDRPGGLCLLEWAVHYNELEVFNLLLESGAEPTRCTAGYPDRFYEFWIMRYCEHSSTASKVFNSLQDAGVIPNDPSSVLLVAANYKCPEGALSAIRNGADPNQIGPAGLRPLHNAVRSATERNIELARILIEAGADPQMLSDSGETPLAQGKRLLGSARNWPRLEAVLTQTHIKPRQPSSDPTMPRSSN